MAARKHTARGARYPLVLPIDSPTGRDEVSIAFGVALKTARKRAGMTQEQLAEAAHIDRTYPSLLERGLRSPTVLIIMHLAAALGCSVPGLLNTVQWPEGGKRR
jgi:DNA-binding XRE family transcriptional regulator